MQQAMSSAGSTHPAPDDLAIAIAEAFSVMVRLFSHQFSATFNDDKARAVWQRAIALAGLDAPAVRAGLTRASQRGDKWAPNCPEFIRLCRRPVPDAQCALAEAVRWAGGRLAGAWSHPAVGVAAAQVGTWDLRRLPEHQALRVFAAALRDAEDRYHRGETLEPPATVMLEHKPMPVVISEEQRAAVRARNARFAADTWGVPQG